MVHELGGNEKIEYGAIGFALGIERILLSIGTEHAQTLMSSVLEVYVVIMKEEYLSQSFLLLQQLRDAGIRADMSFAGGSMKSQMNRANRSNAPFALIIGDQEFKEGTVSLKDMRSSQQDTFQISKVIEVIKEKLK